MTAPSRVSLSSICFSSFCEATSSSLRGANSFSSLLRAASAWGAFSITWDAFTTPTFNSAAAPNWGTTRESSRAPLRASPFMLRI